MHYSKLTIALLLLLCGTTATVAQTPFVPNEKPRLAVGRAPGAIKIDGEIDDAGWNGAAKAENFAEHTPGDKVQPPVATEVLVTYDAEDFYLAFICYDDPATVRVTMRDRDEIFSDDYIGIILDTYGDAAWAYEIFVNPYGLQGDLKMLSDGEEEMTFDIVFESRGKLTAQGWQAEVAIPFSSLRFPHRPVQEWRATFWRNRSRSSRERSTWAAIDRDEPCFPCQFGYLTGIEGAAPGSRLEVLPSLVGYQYSVPENSDDLRAGLKHENPDGEASLNLRYLLSSDLTADIAVNPDFSQVESDAAQIDVNNNFALFYPEKRPFFQEGSDVFRAFTDVVYTRSLNDPLIAAKLTGRATSKTTVGYVGARDEVSPIILPFDEHTDIVTAGKSVSNIGRVRQSLGEDSYVGAIVTDRRLDDGGSGSVAGADVSLRFLKNYRLVGQLLASRTVEPNNPALYGADDDARFDRGRHTAAFDGEKYWGSLIYAGLEREARVWNLEVSYRGASPTFRADNGFVFRNNQREGDIWTGLFFRPNRKVVKEVSTSIALGRIWNYAGKRKDEWVSPEVVLLFPAQTTLELGYLFSRETYQGIFFPGIRDYRVGVSSRFIDAITVELLAKKIRYIARRVNPPALGRGWEYEAVASIKAFERLVVQPEYGYSELSFADGRKIFAGYVWRTKLNYQFTREWFLRLVFQYDNFDRVLNIEPLISYKFNPFTIFYAGSSHNYRNLPNSEDLALSGRQFFFKFQYLLRL